MIYIMHGQGLPKMDESGKEEIQLNPHSSETTDPCANPGFRVKISEFSGHAGAVQMRKFIQSQLGGQGLSFRKFKFTPKLVFITLASEAEADEAVRLLDGAKFKQSNMQAKRACEEQQSAREPSQDQKAPSREVKSSVELVTPLAGIPYEQQLRIKQEQSQQLVNALTKQLMQANARNALVKNDGVLKQVLPSPVVDGYRNKCEFSIGYSDDQGQDDASESRLPVVGFVSGKMADRKVRVVPADDCSNLSLNTRAIVRHFQTFVREFGEEPFDEFARRGYWKMLTVKDFLGDAMLIVTVHPHPNDSETSARAKKALVEKFLSPIDCSAKNFPFNVTSLYWQVLENASDQRNYEHVAGSPYVYETLLGVQFRISPSTFFQTNTRAAGVMYSAIGDLFGLPKAKTEKVDNYGEEELACEVPEKRLKLDEKVAKEDKRPEPVADKSSAPCVLLDICCGAGSISLCLMQRIRAAIRAHPADVPFSAYGTVGVELCAEAVRDARKNAEENGFDGKRCVYLDGQAESIFKELQFHMPRDCPLAKSRLLGILDPPRAGLSDKVMISCRKLEQLESIIYVSCDPNAAMKNIVSLCRPCSRKFEGTPFRIVTIQPVDMFPQTTHFEWLVKLER